MTPWPTGFAFGSKQRRFKADISKKISSCNDEEFVLAFGDVQVHLPDEELDLGSDSHHSNNNNNNNNNSHAQAASHKDSVSAAAFDEVDLNDLVDLSMCFDESLAPTTTTNNNEPHVPMTEDADLMTMRFHEAAYPHAYAQQQQQQPQPQQHPHYGGYHQQHFVPHYASPAHQQQHQHMMMMMGAAPPPYGMMMPPHHQQQHQQQQQPAHISHLSMNASLSASSLTTESGFTTMMDSSSTTTAPAVASSTSFSHDSSSSSHCYTDPTAIDHEVVSTVSNEDSETGNSSRSHKKRRRTATTSTPVVCTPSSETWHNQHHHHHLEIPDHDVVLGDTHEPTGGTRIYRDVRKPYAKKTVSQQQLKAIKEEFQRRVEQELRGGAAFANNAQLPRFWCKKEHKNKTQQVPVTGFLKNRPGITYALAQDQAIKDDIKNASAKIRTRNAKRFNFKGSLDQVVEEALTTCDQWVGESIEKELYAKGLKDDVTRITAWRQDYIRKRETAERRAAQEPVMRGTHMREAQIHEAHARHLEIMMVDMVNQLGNLMIDTYRTDAKKAKNNNLMTVASVVSSTASDNNSASILNTSSSSNNNWNESFSSLTTSADDSMPPPATVTAKTVSSGSTISPLPVPSSSTKTSIVRKNKASKGESSEQAPSPKKESRTTAEPMETTKVDEAPLPSNMMVVPPGLPREVPAVTAGDELSVLSVPGEEQQQQQQQQQAVYNNGQPSSTCSMPRPAGQDLTTNMALLQQQIKPATANHNIH